MTPTEAVLSTAGSNTVRAKRPALAVSDAALAVAVVVSATLFNAGLALLNAHGLSMNSGAVIACEMLITGAAAVLGLHGRLALKQAWLALAGLVFVFALVNGFGSGGFDPKFIRDVLLIPIFVLLGLSCDRREAVRTVMILQVTVVAVMLFEAVRPEDYGRLFDVMSYYVNTRGFQTDQFWNKDSDLFVSATRPGERFLLGGLDIHRLSSVFLEPVSLGNYCVVVAIVAAALWPSLSVRQRVFVVVSEALILVGCDGRFATVAIMLIIALRFAAPALPRYSNALYLPALLAVAALVVTVFAVPAGGDDFSGRTAGSIHVLSLMSVPALLGFTSFYAYQVMDSGIGYLLFSQSLVGAIVIWGFIALGMPQRDRATIVTAHAVSLYVALLLLISYSFFSIKTAALLWFSYGAIARPVAGRQRAAAAAAEPPLPEGQPA